MKEIFTMHLLLRMSKYGANAMQYFLFKMIEI